MKTIFRNICLIAIVALFSAGAPIGGEAVALAGEAKVRTCTMKGTWASANSGQIETFQVIGFLIKTSGIATFAGQTLDGQLDILITGQEQKGQWNLMLEYASSEGATGMTRTVVATEVETESNKKFELEGQYETQLDRMDVNKSGPFTLAGTCRKDG